MHVLVYTVIFFCVLKYPMEDILCGFLTSTLPVANTKGIAVIGMKVLGASHYIHAKYGITPELLIRYALSHNISVPIVGCSTAQEVKTLADSGRDTTPLSSREKSFLTKAFKPHAQRFAFYRGVI